MNLNLKESLDFLVFDFMDNENCITLNISIASSFNQKVESMGWNFDHKVADYQRSSGHIIYPLCINFLNRIIFFYGFDKPLLYVDEI